MTFFFSDEPKSIGLYLLNAGHKQVHISVINLLLSFFKFLQKQLTRMMISINKFRTKSTVDALGIMILTF